MSVQEPDDDGIDCAATAAHQQNALVMLVRREGECIAALLKRLDRALDRHHETGETVDQIYCAPLAMQ